MQTGRRPDTIDTERTVAERVRKLEVMPNPRTVPPSKWAPNRDDLYAIAGHILMLGCFGQPHGITGQWEKVYQASQYLWAQLDERGFPTIAEASQWTDFLARMGALVYWERYVAVHGTFTFRNVGDVSDAELAEARPPFPGGPFLRIGFVGASPLEGVHRFQARALWFTGIPTDIDWIWRPSSAPTDLEGLDLSGYLLWDGTGPINQGYLENPRRPVAQQTNQWVDPSTDPETLRPCGPIEGEGYNPATDFGTPMGPFDTGAHPCPGMPAGRDAIGEVFRWTLVLPAPILMSPPRIQHASLLSNDLYNPANLDGGEIISDGPTLDWLAEGASVLLPDYPAVQGFYSTHLPIAYGSARRGHHYNYQQLQTSIAVRGRVEAQYRPDRVILKGQLYCPTGQLEPELFHWPDEWPHPDYALATAPAFTANDGAGGIVPLTYNRLSRRFLLGGNWPVDREGPLLIRLDGVVIPLRLDESLA